MAKRRDLKKDINYLTNEVISDCFAYMYVHSQKNKEKVHEIIESTVQARNELIAKVCQAKNEKDKKKVKAYFKELRKNMMENIEGSFKNLSNIAQ